MTTNGKKRPADAQRRRNGNLSCKNVNIAADAVADASGRRVVPSSLSGHLPNLLKNLTTCAATCTLFPGGKLQTFTVILRRKKKRVTPSQEIVGNESESGNSILTFPHCDDKETIPTRIKWRKRDSPPSILFLLSSISRLDPPPPHPEFSPIAAFLPPLFSLLSCDVVGIRWR